MSIFGHRSTTKKIVSNPLALGNPLMKSIEMSAQTFVGMGRGCSKPTGLRVEFLFC